MSKIILTRGAPGSGKTYFAKHWVSEKPELRTRIERDEIRNFLGVKTGDNEELVTKIQREMVTDSVKRGKEVIISDTNLKNSYLTAWYEFGYLHDVSVEVVPIITDLETTLRQNLQREVTKIVPERTVLRMYKQSLKDIPENPYVDIKPYIPGGEYPTVTCDLDGTLAHMEGRRGPFDYHKASLDSVDERVLHAIMVFYYQGHKVVFLTGRSDKYEDETRKWLDKYVPEYTLHMRKEGDFRRDSIVKSEMVDNYISDKHDVVLHFDDRNQVVSVLRKKGLKVAQVQEGDF